MFPGRNETGKGAPAPSSSPWTARTRALVLIAAAGCVITGILSSTAPSEPVANDDLFKVFPDAAVMEEIKEPFPHYLAHDASGKIIGAVVVSDSVPPSVSGYLGEIAMATGVTTGGRITLATPVRHRETPYYMEMIAGSGLYEELRGIDLTEPFPGIDSVSGATVSSRAIVRDVRETASLAARTLFGIRVPLPAVPEKNPWANWKTGLLAVLLTASLLAGFAGDRSTLHLIVMLLNLIGVGFILNTPLTISALSRILTLDLPGPGNTLLIVLLVYIAASLPFQGRSYCRLVCPFGTLQHLAARLSPWQLTFSPEVSSLLPGLRHLVLGLLLFLGVWVGWAGFTEVEPFFGLFSLKLTSLLWIVVIFVLTASVFIRRFWCNTMCPTGTLLSVVSRALRPRKGSFDETV